MSLIESQRSRAVEVLRQCSHETGIKGSGGSHGHHQVWARDSMITLLGAQTLDDPTVRTALGASLDTLRRHQSPAGSIPNHVDVVTGIPNFRAYADGGLWYVIGSTLMRPDLATVRRVLRWYSCQDVDACGLISIQEASDWQDLFCTRGKGLYVNCLYVMALDKAAELAESRGQLRQAERYRFRAGETRAAINQRMWYAGDGQMLRHVSHTFSTSNPELDSLGRRRWMPPKRILADASYYLPFIGFREIGEWFDSLGNLLAILAGVADARQTNLILDFIAKQDLACRPIKALFPVVEPGDTQWRDYYGTVNLPHHYHNGGVWPFIGGFYVAALVKAERFQEAEAALNRLAELNLSGDFNEWHLGTTFEPLGVRQQAWSAGMYLYAVECAAAGRVLFL